MRNKNSKRREAASGNPSLPLNQILFAAALLITTLCSLVPFLPKMPSDGLDPSWMFGLNEAVAQGFIFGRDIIFTFGPYASIHTRTFHPGTDGLMMWGSMYLAASFALAAFLNFKESKLYVRLLFLAVMASAIYLLDPVLFYYPLLVGFHIFNSNASPISPSKTRAREHLLLFVLLGPLGFLPLIKGSALIVCIAVLVLLFVLLVFRGDWRGAILTFISPLIVLPSFWAAAGQPLGALPSYFASMFWISSGYTGAMSTSGKMQEVALYMLGVTTLLWALLRQVTAGVAEKTIVLLMFSIVLFIAFKGGFVRHDGHAIIAGTTILLVGLLVISIGSDNGSRVALFAAVLAWLHIYSNHMTSDPAVFLRNIVATYENAWNGLSRRIVDPVSLRHDYQNAVARLRDMSGFPVLNGTTDIYSYDQSYLIASGNKWSPRPVFQSYSAYTPVLSEKNRAHLTKPDGPRNLIFKVQPIDGRIPSLEEGASWPVILSLYEPEAIKSGFLFLSRRRSAFALPDSIVHRAYHVFGERVKLPGGGSLILAKTNIKKSLLGELADIFFKNSQLEIALNMKNGEQRRYRIIPGLAKAGFLISPVIDDAEEFGLLYGGTKYLEDKTVESISVSAASGRSLWNESYELELREFNAPPQPEVIKLFSFERPEPPVPTFKVAIADSCDGNVDVVNGMAPVPAAFNASSLLDVRGWLAISADKGMVPEEVRLALTAADGQRYFIRTKKDLRPDVGAYFKMSRLDASGYAVVADVSGFNGRYTMQLAYADNGVLKLCPQFNFVVELTTPSTRLNRQSPRQEDAFKPDEARESDEGRKPN